MKALHRRLSVLEQRGSDMVRPWLQIIQDIGQTEEEARAAYEKEHGAIGDDPCIIWRVVV